MSSVKKEKCKFCGKKNKPWFTQCKKCGKLNRGNFIIIEVMR